MAVYLQDGMVLLENGAVATSSDCCCGGCTDCAPQLLFHAFCIDEDGNCHVGPDNCDGTCSGAIVDCNSFWLVYNQYCIQCPENTTFPCARSTVNPITCEQTDECLTVDCCNECPGSSTQIMTEQAVFCPGLSPAP